MSDLKEWEKEDYEKWLEEFKDDKLNNDKEFSDNDILFVDFVELLLKDNKKYEETLKEIYLNSHAMNDTEISDKCRKALNLKKG